MHVSEKYLVYFLFRLICKYFLSTILNLFYFKEFYGKHYNSGDPCTYKHMSTHPNEHFCDVYSQ